MTKTRQIVFQHHTSYSDLSWNVDTFLPLYLNRDGNTFLCGDILAYLLAVVTSAVVLQVHDPTLHVSYALERLR